MPEIIGSSTAAKNSVGFNISLLKGGTISQTILGAIISGLVIASTIATILMVSLISYQSPVAVNDTATTYKNIPISINVLANDYDPKANNITLVQLVVYPSYGSAYISSSSAIVYKSNGTYSGNDTFSYEITNGYMTANATVVVTVVNRPPEAIPIQVTVSKNVKNTLINIFDYVGDKDEKITDPDSVDVIRAVSYSNQTVISGNSADSGYITIDAENGYYYSPASGFNGVEQFAYTISDGYDTSSSIITVTVSNDPPTAVDDTFRVPKFRSLVLNVTSNDYDINGDDFNITSALGTGYGAINIGEKQITYITSSTVSTKYSDSFEYTISDGVSSASAVVVVQVYNTAPVVYSKTVTVAKSSANNSITLDYYDADGKDLIVPSSISPSLTSVSASLQKTTTYVNMFFECCDWLSVETNNYTLLFTRVENQVYTQTFTVVMSDGESTNGVLGTWLTSKVIGFNYKGLGSIILHSIKTKQYFVEKLAQIPNVYILTGDCNIVCFVIAKKGELLSQTNNRTNKLFQYFSPENFEAEHYASMTCFKNSLMVEQSVKMWNGEFDGVDGNCLKVLRMVFMNPFTNTPAAGYGHVNRLLSVLENMTN